MATNPAAYALVLMRQFETAVRNHEVKGLLAPSEREVVENNYQRAKEKLARKIGQLANDLAKHEDHPANR